MAAAAPPAAPAAARHRGAVSPAPSLLSHFPLQHTASTPSPGTLAAPVPWHPQTQGGLCHGTYQAQAAWHSPVIWCWLRQLPSSWVLG